MIKDVWQEKTGQAGCKYFGYAFPGTSASAAASRLASRGKDQGQMSIITTVTLVNNLPWNGLDSVIAICRKQTAVCLFLDTAMKTVACLRVSTHSQDLSNQKLEILEFSQKRRSTVDEFIEARISS